MPAEIIRVEGLKELQATLEQIKSAHAKRILSRGLRAGAQVFQREIVSRTKVRPDLPSTTALPVSAMQHDIEIHTKRTESERKAIVYVGPGKYTAHAARWVEFGHRMVVGGRSKLLANGKTKGPGKQMTDEHGELVFVPAYPFLRPAYEAGYSPALEAVKVSMAQDVQNLRAKGAA